MKGERKEGKKGDKRNKKGGNLKGRKKVLYFRWKRYHFGKKGGGGGEI